MADDLAVPEIHQRVTDLSGTLSAGDQQELDDVLAQFENATSNQIAVLIVPSLEGESLEDYSLRVSEKNKFGKKGRDNGILLFIAKEDRKLRIEVGYGLEGALPDITCDQIIRHEIVPHFRSGDYAGGIRAGVAAILEATKGEYKADNGNKRVDGIRAPFGVFVFIAFLLLRILFARRRGFIGRRGYMSGPWFWGGGGGFGGGGFGGGGGFSGGGGSFGGGGASGSW